MKIFMQDRTIFYAISPTHPYFNLMQVEIIYEYLNGSEKGLNYFSEKAKEIASRNPKTKAYQFKDEEKLFKLFKEFLPEVIENQKISSFGELMQKIS